MQAYHFFFPQCKFGEEDGIRLRSAISEFNGNCGSAFMDFWNFYFNAFG
jgi:hypothetical protein